MDKRILSLLILVLGISTYLFGNIQFSLKTTNCLTDFSYSGQTEKSSLTNYYAGEMSGGALLALNDDVSVTEAIVRFEDGKQLVHRINESGVFNVTKAATSSQPVEAVLMVGSDIYDTISLQATTPALYSFTDGTQTYRHIYINEAGVFLGEFIANGLDEDVKQNIMLEFCHKDEKTSGGYHVFARKLVSLSKWIKGEDLGFSAFLNGARYDENEDVYVIITFSDTNIVELPLQKGVNPNA